MVEERACACQEKHQHHLCVLRCKGLTRQIEELTDSPNVACTICGEEANSEDHVCIPVPLFI